MIRDYFIHKQSEGMCGPANLNSLVAYYTGKTYGEEFFSRMTGANSEEGCNPEQMLQAIGRIGLSGELIERNMTPLILEDFLRRGIPPLVCYEDPEYEDHWAVVLNATPSKISLANTVTAGTKTFRRDFFSNLWFTSEGLSTTLIVTPR